MFFIDKRCEIHAYFTAFNRHLIRKNTTKYRKSQQTTEAEAGHFLYFNCKVQSSSGDVTKNNLSVHRGNFASQYLEQNKNVYLSGVRKI